jgi:rubrerythrin
MSSEVILGVLQNLAEIEKNARDVYRELYEELEDEELKRFIGELIKSEERHKRLVEEALRLVRGSE